MPQRRVASAGRQATSVQSPFDASKEAAMCVPGCQEAIHHALSRAAASMPARRRRLPRLRWRRRPAVAAPRPFTSVVDLTHTMSADFPTFDGTPGIEMQKVKDLKKDGYNLYQWRLIEHSGTHLDAPIHFSEAGISGRANSRRHAGGAARRDQRGRQGGEGSRLPALTRRSRRLGAPARTVARQLLRRHAFRLGAARCRQGEICRQGCGRRDALSRASIPMPPRG